MLETNQPQQDINIDQKSNSKPRRVKRGVTVSQMHEVRQQNESVMFNDSTIEALLNASDEMLLVIEKTSLDIFAVNKIVENKMNASYLDLDSLYSLLPQETLVRIAAGESEIENQIMTSSSGEDYFVNIESTPIHWCGQDAILLKIIEKDEKISKKAHDEQIQKIERLAAGIGHDINNALTTVVGNLGLMALDSTDKKTTNYIHEMIESVTRGSKLLHSFMRLNSNRELDLETKDLSASIKELIKPLHLETWKDRYDIKFVFTETNESHECSFDETSISRIIQNLLQNAKDAMPKGGTVSVTVRNLDLKNLQGTRWKEVITQDSVGIFIEDNGTGIPKENLDQIFEPEYSTKIKTSKGHGLGLVVAKQQIEKHGGQIFVTSQTGRNAYTKFWIILPKNT